MPKTEILTRLPRKLQSLRSCSCGVTLCHALNSLWGNSNWCMYWGSDIKMNFGLSFGIWIITLNFDHRFWIMCSMVEPGMFKDPGFHGFKTRLQLSLITSAAVFSVHFVFGFQGRHGWSWLPCDPTWWKWHWHARRWIDWLIWGGGQLHRPGQQCCWSPGCPPGWDGCDWSGLRHHLWVLAAWGAAVDFQICELLCHGGPDAWDYGGSSECWRPGGSRYVVHEDYLAAITNRVLHLENEVQVLAARLDRVERALQNHLELPMPQNQNSGRPAPAPPGAAAPVDLQIQLDGIRDRLLVLENLHLEGAAMRMPLAFAPRRNTDLDWIALWWHWHFSGIHGALTLAAFCFFLLLLLASSCKLSSPLAIWPMTANVWVWGSWYLRVGESDDSD